MALTSRELESAKNTKLAISFTLYELIASSSKPGLVDYPSADIISKLKMHAEDVLQPIRNEFGRVQINSGYRNENLNKAVGGVENSIHKIYHKGKYLGTATDIVTLDEPDFLKVIAFIKKSVPEIKRVIIYRDTKALRINNPFLHVDRHVGVPKGELVILEKIAPGKYINFDESELANY